MKVLKKYIRRLLKMKRTLNKDAISIIKNYPSLINAFCSKLIEEIEEVKIKKRDDIETDDIAEEPRGYNRHDYFSYDSRVEKIDDFLDERIEECIEQAEKDINDNHWKGMIEEAYFDLYEKNKYSISWK